MALWTLICEVLWWWNLLVPRAGKVVDACFGVLSWVNSLSCLLDVQADLRKLRHTVDRIHDLLQDAEETRFIEESHVRLWLSGLKDIAFDAEDLLDEIQTRVNVSKLQDSRKRKRPWHFFSVSPVLRRWLISREIAKIWEKYRAITEHRDYLPRREGEYRRKAQVREERLPPEAGSLQGEPLIVGIDNKKRELVQLLISGGGDGVAVVSVLGAGGIGKTTLARLAFGDQAVVNLFPLKFWIGVSQGFDVKKTTKEIIEVMTAERCDASNLELLQRRLQQLVSGRKFLLVLDGVWNEEQYYWEMLRAPLMAGGNGSRILVTTRSELVSKNMRTLPPIHLNGLEEEHCWSLFRDLAFKRGAWDRHQNLVEIGREIVEKCQGLPLAVQSIGGLLYNKTDEEEWRSVLSDLPDPEPDDDAYRMLPTLKVSYDHLPLHLKQCFAFCSVFPNGYEFDRDELVKLWIAVGLVKPRGMRPLENIGGKYFDYLLWRSFFHISSSSNQQSKRKYKMPGLIYELAQSFSEHQCLRFENNAVHGESENSHYVVSSLQNMDPIAFQKIYENQGLRSFILLPENGVPMKQVPNHLFRNLKHLRALDLRQNELVALPDAIGNLIHLRFLNLYGTQIERLPESVSNLYNLQVLEFGECNKLLELPKGTSNLVNLRHLGLHLNWDKHRNRWIDLISMPPGIGQLTSLRTLSRFSVSGESGCGLGQLKDLDLRGELCISKLENVVNVNDAADANLRNKKYIDFLMLRWSESTYSNSLAESGEQVIKNLHPHTNIRTLWIDNYNGTSFPDWLQDQSFSNLDTLRLSNCRRCGVLPLVGKLPQLRNLYLEGLPEVQYMGCVVPDNGNTMGFPLLEMLFIANMRSLESWYEVIQGEMACLKKLVISYCPKIKELSHLPRSLEYFEMRNCQKLLSLPVLPLLQELVIKGGTGEIIRWIHQLTSLSSLTVSQLSRVKSLPRGYLHNLKVLRELKIEGCDKLKSVALQDLASLELLEISSCQKLSSFGDGGLPATLKEFRLRFCDNLKSLPTRMHLLPSLNHMEICNVPMLTSLPTEGLPYSLKYLAISGCALLQRCCERNGADWPKIQHIPLRDICDSSSS
ncbi:putative disease resistance protein RGA3 [Phoenix dactylifera]|uniref:Disease resistance protein RGA3 n=1 Tax=Phoenix dactylifera TaxID=42345 RepID=A0A8B9A4V7_PHODC|nr:putative disease resistance protein RGA3 [Phoenix dactylifera]